MGSRKIDKANYGPGLMEVFLGAVLSLVLGLSCAVVYLVLKPVHLAKPTARYPVPGPTTYVRGTRDNDRGKQWLRKKQLFTEGSSVAVNEDELNAWITAGTEPERPKANAPKQLVQAPQPPPTTFVSFGTPNFRVHNGTLQIGLDGTVDLDLIGVKQGLALRATGQFAKRDDTFVFVPEQFYVGACPFHQLPGMTELLVGRLLGEIRVPDDIAAAWKKLADVTIDGNSLVLTMRAQKD